MVETLKFIKSLIAQGYATASQKAELSVKLAELEEDEQEAIAEDAEAVEALPEEDPEEEAKEEEAAKAIMKSIDSKIATAKEDLEDKFDAELKKLSKSNVTKSSSVDWSELKSFGENLKNEKKTKTIEISDFDFRQKSNPIDMSEADSFDGTVAISELDPMISRDAQRQPFIEELVSVGNISAPIDVWIETTNEEGEVLPVAELAKLPQKSYDFKENSARVKKIGVFSKYSAEMAEDLPNLISEVRNFLISDLRRKVDEQILTGDGNDENLTGILENATPYSAGAFAGSITDANRFDVVETAVTQVLVAHHNPNFIVLNPVDRAKMNLAKATDGHYVMPPFIAADGNIVSGVRVIANTGIAVGTFLVGDFSRSSVKYRRGLTLELSNADDDDFTRDRFTVKGTVRLVHRVRENDFQAFVVGDFATAIEALEPSP